MVKIVMMLLDALGFSKLSKDHSPFLYELSEKGIFGKINPLFAYRGIEPTIFSGLYPDQHQIWLDYYYDPSSSPFKWTYNPFVLFFNYFIKKIPQNYVKKVFTAPLCYTTRYLNGFSNFPRSTLIPWNLLRNFNVSMKRTIIERNSLGKVQTLFDILRNNNLNFNYINFPFVHKDKDTMREVRASILKKEIYNFNLIRFFDLDTIGHEFGPASPKFNVVLRKTDEHIKEIFEAFEKIDDIIFLIISDHGMVKVNKITDIISFLNHSSLHLIKDYQIFLDSTIARFYSKNEKIKKKIRELLSNLPNGHFLTSEEKKQLNVPNLEIYGNLIFVVDSGTLILPNFYQGTKKINGMHGYIPKNSELDALFLLTGSNISTRKIKPKIKLIDILPTILEILNLQAEISFEGKSILKF